MDPILWPFHKSAQLPRIVTIFKENFLNHNETVNLYYNNNLNLLDLIVCTYHTSELLPHIFINYEKNFLYIYYYFKPLKQ